MAHYENLPIYKAAMDLTIYMETIVKGFSRYHKYSIGNDFRELSRKLVLLVIRANSKWDKVDSIVELRDTAESMKTVLFIGKETKAFQNFKQFETSSRLAVDICRQAEGWLKSQRKDSRNL